MSNKYIKWATSMQAHNIINHLVISIKTRTFIGLKSQIRVSILPYNIIIHIILTYSFKTPKNACQLSLWTLINKYFTQYPSKDNKSNLVSREKCMLRCILRVRNCIITTNGFCRQNQNKNNTRLLVKSIFLPTNL